VIPLGDSLGGQRRPFVTLTLIALCALVFLYELTLRGAALDQFVETWGAVPRLVLAALSPAASSHAALLTLFTSQFIHAGFLHLGGNMLFLWVFGRAVEDRLGSAIFLPFYLIVGALAGLAQCFMSAGESLPLIGASGAIAGVLGLYFLSYPTAWVRVLLPILFFFWTFDLPAVLVLAFWFVSQFFSGVAAITHASRATSGDVAVWAHVAGFMLGVACALLLPNLSSGGAKKLGGAGGVQRSNAPGPARLVSSLADLAALLLAVRLVLRFLGLVAARSPITAIAVPIVSVTEPVVAPFQGLLPSVRVFGGVVEISTLVAMVAVYLLAGLIGQLFLKTTKPKVSSKPKVSY
jgi:membrane associated rhomboid family serine protease